MFQSRFFDEQLVEKTALGNSLIKLNDLMKESRRLLKIVKRQSALIESLERRYPGITKIKRDPEGDIIISDEIGNGERDALIEEIDTLVKKCETFFVEKP